VANSIISTERVLNFSARVLAGIVWISSLIFGLYILSFYFVALLDGNTSQWNKVLPGLYDSQTEGATLGVGLHFAAGGIILILGCVQFIQSLRNNFPAVHRWMGRVYVLASIITAIGGLTFIVLKGTIGGWVMDVAFAGYGILTFIAAVQTIRFARQGKMKAHRAWGIRLFALAIGSWLYRMDYGFWFLFTGGIGHTEEFRGIFDYFMDFWFYLPNLAVAELFIRRTKLTQSNIMKWTSIFSLWVANVFLVLATYFFTKRLWGEAILDLVGL
jgi:uncharacterized membrane protein